MVENKTNTAFTTPYIDVTTNELTISAVAPININGQFKGVAGADIDMQTIAKIIDNIDFLGLGYGFLLDHKGQILSHPNSKLNSKALTELFGKDIELADTFTEHQVADETVLVSFTKIHGIENVDWYLGAVINKDTAFESVSAFGQKALIYLIVGTLVIVFALQLLLRYFNASMYRLNDAIRDIAQGEGDLTRRLSVENDDEFGPVK